jgi:hypothetical protein
MCLKQELLKEFRHNHLTKHYIHIIFVNNFFVFVMWLFQPGTYKIYSCFTKNFILISHLEIQKWSSFWKEEKFQIYETLSSMTISKYDPIKIIQKVETG